MTQHSRIQSRQTSACEFCKRLHIRCDNAFPCSNCHKRNFTCLYPTKKRRGPKEKKNRTPILPTSTVNTPPVETKIVPLEASLSLTTTLSRFIQVHEHDPNFHWLKELPPLDLYNFNDDDLPKSKLDQKMCLLGALMNGARQMRNFEMAETIYKSGRDIFTKLFGQKSLEYIKGAFLIGHYCFSMGRYDESLCYFSLCNQLLSARYVSLDCSPEIGSMFAHIIGVMAASTLDRQDRYNLYLKGKRISADPYDQHKLSVNFCYGEITHSNNTEDWNFDMVSSILNEGESILQASDIPDNHKVAKRLMLWTHRAAAYWKAGRYDLCFEWSSKATELSFDVRIEYHLLGVMVSLAILTKMHMLAGNLYDLEMNLKILELTREHFPFIQSQISRAKRVLARHSSNFKESDEVEDQDCSTSKYFDDPSSSFFVIPPVNPPVQVQTIAQ
eukprot:TRINITY_DN2118_c1_g1_i1.p1 TRINITY_DN2118_c1_g1~~TRINITY_DN2118_c1_g1_i1.p1  ORF type:complete len:443 (+),score=65.18 TRINITY_DN2118_c1_g1_i1:55-1383(+)